MDGQRGTRLGLGALLRIISHRLRRAGGEHDDVVLSGADVETSSSGEMGEAGDLSAVSAVSAVTSASAASTDTGTQTTTTTTTTTESERTTGTSNSASTSTSTSSSTTTASDRERCPACGQIKRKSRSRSGRPDYAPRHSEQFRFVGGIDFGEWPLQGTEASGATAAAASSSDDHACTPTTGVPPASSLPSSSDPSSSAASSSTPLTTFHPFPRLPPELRRKIYRLYMARPRIVEIRCVNDLRKIYFAPNALGKPASNVSWRADNTLPALMWVCREARDECQAFYRIRLPVHPTWRVSWPVHVNPDWDTVVFTFPWAAEVPMDILLSDLLAYDPLGVGIKHFGVRQRCGPQFWDLTPVEGCAPLAVTLRNLKSWTQVVQVHDGPAGMEFPVWMVHEGYLTGALKPGLEFYDRLVDTGHHHAHVVQSSEERRNSIQTKLGQIRESLRGFVPDDALDGLVVQQMYFRKFFKHLNMWCTRTDRSALGMVRLPSGEGAVMEEMFLSTGRMVPVPTGPQDDDL